MKWNRLAVVAAAAAIAGGVCAQSVAPQQVRNWAAGCAGCHGSFGIAQAGMESIAGFNRDEMLKKLLDFKRDKKPATLMHQLAKGYSDEELAALADYFSRLKK